MTTITIEAGPVRVRATLFDNETAKAITEALPLEASAMTWGDEIYFEIPVELPQQEDAKAEVDVGELGYWPVGRAFCIFFGPTPASTDSQPRAASPVNVFGRLSGDATDLRHVGSGSRIRVTLFDQSG